MTIPGSANPLLLKSAAAAGGYQIERSLRFNSSDSAFCGRVPASAGNRTTWTFSTWIKRSKLGVLQRFFTGATATNDNDWTAILFNASDQLVIGGYSTFFRTSNSVYRDCSAWYHLVVLADLGNGTNSLKLRAWINNEEVAWSSTSSNPTTTGINAANNHAIGAEQSPNNGGVGSYFDGYLADIHFIDGQALTPSSFTEVSATTGQLIPKAYTGSYGTNGFQLKFADNSSNTAATLGKDTSGNGNNWSCNNISPSDGATYSNRGSLSSSPPTLSGTISDIFDGLLNSSNAFSVNQANAGVTINFSPALPSGSSVKLVGGVYGTAGSNNSLQVNGTGYAQSLPASTGTYTEIVEVSVPAGASGITSIYIYREGTSTFNFALYGIKVNDVLLVDGAAGDSLVDTPTSYGTDTGAGGEVRGNYCTFNPLFALASLTLTNGNLETSSPGAAWRNAKGTFAMTTGKWYWEHTVPTTGAADGYIGGVATATADYSSSSTGIWGRQGTTKYSNGSSSTPFGSTTSGDILGFAFDADAGKLWVAQNGTWVGDPGAGTGESWSGIPSGVFPYVAAYNQANVVNFGQRAFAYTNNRSGFKALVDTNLTSTTITISGSYTGNGVADGPFVYLNGVPTAMTIGGNAVTFGTHADKLANGFKIRTSSTTYNQNASSYSYSITSTGAAFKNARAQPNP